MSIWDRYECPYCDPEDYDNYEVFNSVEELAQHRDKMHPGKPIYACSACEKTFSDWWKAKEHVHWDHDEYCEECQNNYLFEVVYLAPEDKARISTIHTQIDALKRELDVICATPKAQTSSRSETK